MREIAPDVWAAGGYSGQGVALAPFVGKLLAEAALGRPERLDAFTDIPIPALPLATWLRRALITLAILQGRFVGPVVERIDSSRLPRLQHDRPT